ncbi:MAG: hypothetical protein HN348_31910, partial [Proteobacteria bacterium]|nr:hypothetical protein [Pseudomonadota bacterium]
MLQLLITMPALALTPVMMEETSLGALGEVSLSVEGLGDYFGRSRLRAALGLDVVHGKGPWRVGVVAGLRRPALVVGAPVHGDLFRFGVDYHSGMAHLSAGRTVLRDARGWLRLDGAHLSIDHGEVWTNTVWLGRLWAPDTALLGYQALPFVKETFVVGTGVSIKPLSSGPWRGTWALGAEGRTAGGSFGFRAYGAASASHLRGSLLSSLVEVGQVARGDGGLRVRALAEGELPLGADVTTGLALRWEGLQGSWTTDGTPSLMNLLDPSGYGLAEGMVKVEMGRTKWLASGGAMVQPDKSAWSSGGRGRVSCLVGPISILATGAAVGSARYLGGGVGAATEFGALNL